MLIYILVIMVTIALAIYHYNKYKKSKILKKNEFENEIVKCKKCGNEIKKEAIFCPKCGNPVNNEKRKTNINKNEKNKNVIIIILVVITVIAIGGGCYYYFMINRNNNLSSTSDQENTQGFEQTSANIEKNCIEQVSFANTSSDDKNLNDIQKDIVSYFDNKYFNIGYSISNLQKYPQVFKNAKVTTNIGIVKVLKSTEDEFEVLATYGSSDREEYNIKDIKSDELFVVKGKQLTERLLANETKTLYGRYINVNEYNIDGISYSLPAIDCFNIFDCDSPEVHRFDKNIITNVAQYIFGKDIKLSKPKYGEDFEFTQNTYTPEDWFYMVTLDNQSNANFKVFDVFQDKGLIQYNIKHNNINSGTQKKLFVSADFEHYIVSTYDESLKHVYIDYFDREYKKIWSREFDYNSTKAFVSPMDYTTTQMTFVIDNDMYLINLATGENVIDPVIVGEKIQVNMMSDGIVLIGDNNKDTIMKVGYDGKILYRINGDTDIPNILEANSQIVNEKMVIELFGSQKYKYLVLNSDGTIDVSTKDM